MASAAKSWASFSWLYTCVHLKYFINLDEKWSNVLEDVQPKFVPALKWESPIPVNVEEAGLMFLGLLIV